jgi:hypothetical protein
VEESNRLEEALAKLDPESRRVIKVWLEGLSHAEAAKILGLTERAFALIRLNAIERLRRLLGQETATWETNWAVDFAGRWSGPCYDDEFEPAIFSKFVTSKASNIDGGLETLSVLPCSIRIDDIMTNVAKAKQGFKTNDEFQRLWGRRREQMKSWLNRNYDFVLIDCPPSLAPQVRFVLTIADSFIVPTVPDRLSVRGSKYLMSRLSTLGFKVKGLGTLWSLYREQNNMHKSIVKRAEWTVPAQKRDVVGAKEASRGQK